MNLQPTKDVSSQLKAIWFKQDFTNKSSGQNGKKDGLALHLELKKAYDFSPSSSDLPNKR